MLEYMHEQCPSPVTYSVPTEQAASGGPEDPNKEAWRRAKSLLGRAGRISLDQSGKLFGKLLRDHGLEARDLLPSIVKAETLGTEDPQSYLTSCAKALAQRTRPTQAAGADISGWSDDVWAQAVANYRKDGAWSASMGPEPGKLGCAAPASILAQNGFGVVLHAVNGGAA